MGSLTKEDVNRIFRQLKLYEFSEKFYEKLLFDILKIKRSMFKEFLSYDKKHLWDYIEMLGDYEFDKFENLINTRLKLMQGNNYDGSFIFQYVQYDWAKKYLLLLIILFLQRRTEVSEKIKVFAKKEKLEKYVKIKAGTRYNEQEYNFFLINRDLTPSQLVIKYNETFGFVRTENSIRSKFYRIRKFQ